MALTINVTTTDPTGGPDYASGIHVLFDTRLFAGSTDVLFVLHYYRSKVDFEAGKSEISAPSNCNLTSVLIKGISLEDYFELNAVTLHDLVKDKLEELVGVGNVSIDLGLSS